MSEIKYREVKRKARAGERIRNVYKATDMPIGYETTVIDTLSCGTIVCLDMARDRRYLADFRYVVIEPITDAESDAETLALTRKVNDLSSALDKATEALASLARKVAVIESATFPLSGGERVVSGKVDGGLPSFAKTMTRERVSLTREQVIERAKADVAEYVSRNTDRIRDVQFVVNRDKRTVVALMRTCGAVYRRGIARCAPGDVFSSHIGRAIAVRRALGLDIPAEYTQAPKPTEVRVGDIVRWNTQGSIRGRVTNVGTFVRLNVKGTEWGFEPHDLTVIDDSREEVAE